MRHRHSGEPRERGIGENLACPCRPGAYLRVATPGDVAAGDTIRVRDVPGHALTVRDLMVAEVTGDGRLLRRIVDNPDVSARWVHRAESKPARPRTDRVAKE